MSTTKIAPTADDGLKRQTDAEAGATDSYILVDPETELELGHFKAMLSLGSLGGMELSIPTNAQAAEKAMTKSTEMLSLAIREWHWLDRSGKPLKVKPADNLNAFDSVSMAEFNWMLEKVAGLLKEEAASEGT